MAYPFWHAYTPGWEVTERAAAGFLSSAWSRALAERRYEDARAIQQEMTVGLVRPA